MTKEMLGCIIKRILKDMQELRLAIAIILCYMFFAQIIFGAVCPFRIGTALVLGRGEDFSIEAGLPCPACGLTRAGLCVLRGQLKQAFSYHPAIFFWMGLILWGLIQRYFIDYVKAGSPEKFRQPKHPLYMVCMILCCMVTLVCYLWTVWV